MGIQIRKIDHSNKELWEDYVNRRRDTTFVDTLKWRNVIKNSYSLKNYWYIAEQEGSVKGIMGFTLSNHPIFGKYLATAPFANQGGFYSDTSEVCLSFLKKASELQSELNARYTVIRHLNGSEAPPDGWKEDKTYATFHLPLRSEPQEFLEEHLRSKDRSQIKKSMDNDFNVQFGKTELLNHFWHIITITMKELGSPYHSKNYLELLLNTFGRLAEIVIVYNHKKDPCGGALLIYHKNSVVLLYANILQRYRPSGAGDFLYWSIIEKSCHRQLRFLDMGRSLIGSGNEKYKMKFRPTRKELSYWYNLSNMEQIPQLNQENPKYKLAINTWRQLPLWMTRTIGPKLISGIL